MVPDIEDIQYNWPFLTRYHNKTSGAVTIIEHKIFDRCLNLAFNIFKISFHIYVFQKTIFRPSVYQAISPTQWKIFAKLAIIAHNPFRSIYFISLIAKYELTNITINLRILNIYII